MNQSELTTRVRALASRFWNSTSTAATAWVWLWGAFLLPAVACRVFMNLDRGLSIGFVDLRGLVSDLGMSGLLMLGCVLALRAFGGVGPRIVTALLALIWGALNYGGYENVLANDALIDVSLLKYIGDETFVQGSSDPERPLFLGLIFMLTPLAAWRASRTLAESGPRLAPNLVPTALGLLVLTLWSPSLGELAWRQENFLAQAPERLTSGGRSARGRSVSSDPEVQRAMGRDLVGEVRARQGDGKRPNVLVVFVEGASGAYLPDVAAFHGIEEDVQMPKLSARAKASGLWATQFIDTQRQTNRGEYAVLCGDHPKLSSTQPKMSDYVMGGSRECLPRVLKSAGYHTVYLQAAQLTFMMKDRFMDKIGFDEVLGYPDFPHAYARSGWGVDDRAFYEQVLDRLVEYDQLDKPFFAAVLNIGTHHPFPVPASFEHAEGETKYSRAFAYTDDALDRLLQGLEERGLADHTLVLVISDESQGVRGESHPEVLKIISKNWGPLVAFGPGVEAGRIDDVFLQSDTALSVLDYLGLADRAPHFVGRSFFRDYSGNRPVAFANAHQGRQFWLDENGALLICREGKDPEDACEGYQVDPERVFSANISPREIDESEVSRLVDAVGISEAADSSGAGSDANRVQLVAENARVIDLSEKGRNSAVASGQYLELQDDERLRVRLVYTVVGHGAVVDVQTQVRRLSTFIQAQSAHDPMRAGDTVALEFTWTKGERVTDIDVHFIADVLQAGGRPRMIIEEALAVVEPIPSAERGEPGIEVLHLVEHTRINGRGQSRKLPWFEVSPLSERIRTSGCMTRHRKSLRGEDCAPGQLVWGPAVTVRSGQRIKGGFTVVAGDTPVRGHVEFVFRTRKKKRTVQGPRFDVPAKGTAPVVFNGRVPRGTFIADARVVLEEKADGFELRRYLVKASTFSRGAKGKKKRAAKKTKNNAQPQAGRAKANPPAGPNSG